MDRVEFTLEMKKTHTLLMPNMCDIHFRIIEQILKSYGYKIELLTNTDSSVIEEGLKYVHNDMCYPALLTIGQMIDSLKNGGYDLDKVALMMTQTGGGCRASNYIHLLRKALKDMGLGHIPVISINVSNLEKHSGFALTIPITRRIISTMVYGDLLMLLSNQTKAYEVNKGQTKTLIDNWVTNISGEYEKNKGYTTRDMKKNFKKIVADFVSVELNKVPKVKVGIVGEIYVKYSPLANNNLEAFLESQDCEVMVPGIMGFLVYCVDNNLIDDQLYGGAFKKRMINKIIMSFLLKYEKMLLKSIKKTDFTAPAKYKHLKELVEPVISVGCKMGEGWLLTAEIMELLEHGYTNVICAQPFGCLPNHIVGKGMIRKIVGINEDANIVPIDYDPGATKVNQENRIKLMLSVAKEKLQ